MDPVSLALGLGEILPLIASAISTAKEYIDTVRSARKSIAALINELEVLQANVKNLHSLLKGDEFTERSVHFDENSVLLTCSAACEAKLQSLCKTLKQEAKGKVNRMLWPFTQKEYQKAIQDLRSFTNWMQFALSIDGCRVLSQTSSDVLKLMGQQLESFKATQTLQMGTLQIIEILKDQKLTDEVKVEQETRKSILNWISTSKHYQKHQLIQASRAQETGLWILKRKEFIKWRDHSSEWNILICPGIQGSGKTNIASIIIDQLFDSNSSNDSPVAYFYFDHQDQSTQRTQAVLCSVLRQLLDQLPNIPSSVTELFEKSDRQTQIPLHECERLLANLACDVKCAYLVFDGLDESEHRRSFLQSIQNVAWNCKFRLLVTSRPHIRDMVDMFQHYPNLLIEANREDLKTYLYQELDQGGIYDIADQEFVRGLVRKLVHGAEGMFLLPVLQLRTILKEPTLGEMEDKVADLSGSLNDAFADTISRIQRLPKSRSRVGMDALMWLCHTPRAMKESELSDALAIRNAQNVVNVKYRPTTKTILECCQGLATVDGEGRIRLAHYTIQEYLGDNSGDLFPRAKATIAVTCLRYLVFENFQDGPWPTWFEIESRIKMFPFLAWAARYWGRFTRQTESDPEVWTTLFAFFSSPAATAISNQVRQYSMALIGKYWNESECRSFLALHHASRHGLERALNTLMDSGAYGVNVLTQIGSTPIIHAASGGHLLTTRGLLAHGADPYLSNWYGNALHCATEANKANTVRELVRWGMDPNADHKDRPYLVAALDEDAADAFAALVELGADIELQSSTRSHDHLFFVAALSDCHEVVALMLKRGWAEIEMRNSSGHTAIHCATLGGAVTTVRRLVEAGANIDAMDNEGRTALEHAELDGNRTIAKLLRDCGTRSSRLS
ncbi:unnamed protein product [Penicillium pancosmium]